VESEFLIKDIDEMVKDEAEKEREIREQYIKKGLNPDLLGNKEWWEQVKVEENKIDKGFFGDQKAKAKYSKFLKMNPHEDVDKLLNFTPKEEEIIAKKEKEIKNTHLFENSEESEDFTEEITQYFHEMKEELQDEGLSKDHIKEDQFYELYKDRERVKKMKDIYQEKSHAQALEESIKLAQRMGVEKEEDRNIIFEKVLTEDYIEAEKHRHKKRLLLKKLQLEDEKEDDLKEFLYQEKDLDDFKETWFNIKSRKK
jgi:hypothetical protein